MQGKGFFFRDKVELGLEKYEEVDQKRRKRSLSNEYAFREDNSKMFRRFDPEVRTAAEQEGWGCE